MSRTPGRVSGIVLAGGRSSRFGSSKLDARFGSTSVLEATLARVLEVCDELVVVGRAETPLGGYPGTSRAVRWVRDDAPFEGPLAGLATGLGSGAAELVLAVGGDMPLVRPEVLRLLLARLAEVPAASAACLLDGREARPLPLALRRGPALGVTSDLLSRGERSLRALLGDLATVRVAESDWRAIDPDADSLLDVDLPADLERARSRLSRG